MKVLNCTVMVLLSVFILSCDNGDDATDSTTGVGELGIKFDNSYDGSDLLLGTTTYEANGSERIKIDTLKYIVSNIRLTKEDGTVFTYPKDESLFVVNEGNAESQLVSLKNVPTGSYTQITFGIGVDQEKYQQGAEGQGDFLSVATEEGMMWSWQAGYKFIRYEGRFVSDNVTEETAFAIHMGSHGTALDNYKEITLDLPVSARVRTDFRPDIHVVADVATILNATTAIYLEEKSQIHVDPEKSPQIAVNASEMFSVDHIHN